jgi:hypothetical protein
VGLLGCGVLSYVASRRYVLFDLADWWCLLGVGCCVAVGGGGWLSVRCVVSFVHLKSGSSCLPWQCVYVVRFTYLFYSS